MTRAERIRKLSQSVSDPLGDPDHYQMNDTQVKVGKHRQYILFENGKDGGGRVESNVVGKNNPGFSFDSKGSQLRTGPTLHITTQLQDIRFGNDKAMNPLTQLLPPNIVNFYQPMVPYVDDLVQVTKALGGLSGL